MVLFNVPLRPAYNPIETCFNMIKSYVGKTNVGEKDKVIFDVEVAILGISDQSIKNLFSKSL